MTTFRRIAFDPGGATGWATYTSQVDAAGKHTDVKWLCGTFDWEDHHKDLYNMCEEQRVQNYKVITESFEFRQFDKVQRAGIELISKEYIGVLRCYGQIEGVPIIQQTAASAKKFMPDKGPMANKHLRVMGLWVPGRDNRHAMDAYRHLVFYLVNKDRLFDIVESWKDLV